MSSLPDAVSAWDAAYARYEDLFLEDAEPAAFEGAREELFQAEEQVRKAWSRAVDQLRNLPGTSPVLAALGAGIDARIRIAEHAALDAERNATHGELAGADHDARERIERLEGARDALSALTDAFLDAAVALDQVD